MDNNEVKKFLGELSFPPQSSLKLVSHGRHPDVYYTWEVKVYCDNLDVAFVDLVDIDKKLRDKFMGVKC